VRDEFRGSWGAGKWYAAIIAGALVVVALLAWVTTPRSQGVRAQWEAPAFAGRAVADRALVADAENKVLDLVSGRTITLGSVAGGERQIGGERLLITHGSQIDAARLDATQRWTWNDPQGNNTLWVLATTRAATIALSCQSQTEPSSCTLYGIGADGTTSWTMPYPSTTDVNPTAAHLAGLPEFAVLPLDAGTVMLIDPATSRTILRSAQETWTSPDGQVFLQDILQNGRCRVTSGRSIDALTTSASAPCRSRSEQAGLRPGEVLRRETARVLWFPVPRRHVVEITGGRHIRVASWHELTVLRVDDDGMTVRDGDSVVRYTFTS